MNKKFIAAVSSIAFALAPATTVLADGNGYIPSAENHSDVTGYIPSAENHSDVTGYVPSAENHSDVNGYAPSAENHTGLSNTSVKAENGVQFVQLSLKDDYVQSLIKKFNLGNKKIVDAFELAVPNGTGAYSVTFTNKAVYKDGHVYKVHHYHYKDGKLVEKEAPTATAKNGSITVTLHGASPVLIEDLGAPKTAETKVSKNGRKAALKTGVEY